MRKLSIFNSACLTFSPNPHLIRALNCTLLTLAVSACLMTRPLLFVSMCTVQCTLVQGNYCLYVQWQLHFSSCSSVKILTAERLDCKAKCRYLKILTCKGALRHVFYLPEAPSPPMVPYSPLYTLYACIQYTVGAESLCRCRCKVRYLRPLDF